MTDKPTTPGAEAGKLPANPDGNLPIDLVGDDKKEDKEAPKDSKTEAQDVGDKKTEEEGKKEASSTPTFTQEELDTKIEERLKTTKGGYDGTIKKLRGDIKTMQESMSQLSEQREEEGFAGFLKSVEDQGGDTKAAELIVTRQRSAGKRERDITAREGLIAEQFAELNVAGRTKKAYDLVKEHSLDDKATKELLEEETPEKMEIKALKLALEGKRVAERQPAKLDSGVGSTQGLDESKLTHEQRLGKAIENIEQRR